ncbi:MAG: sulfite exporter TauE/SafE family protein [bacterium]
MDEQKQINGQKVGRKTYFVQGMHCGSCEVLLERKIVELEGVKRASASLSKGQVVLDCQSECPSVSLLNDLFKEEKYVFSEGRPSVKKSKIKEAVTITTAVLLAVTIFFGLNRFGLTKMVNVSSSSSLPTFFILGLVAGVSTCAALVGGIALAISSGYPKELSLWEKIKPHLVFNGARLFSYTGVGFLFGALGKETRPSLAFSFVLVVIVSLFMLFWALGALGISFFRRFNAVGPKAVTRYITGKKAPFLLGALTVLLPCGFTITAEGMALISGSAFQGGLIMFFFALGTLPALLLITFSAIKFSASNLSQQFTKAAAVLILIFSFYNINSQLNAVGLPSFNDLGGGAGEKDGIDLLQEGIIENELPVIIDGKQVLKMDVSSFGYKPNRFKVRLGVPVRWEITDKGANGCTNAIISRDFFPDTIELRPGETSVKEFVPQKLGRYKFSCWMGMIVGSIEVVM